MTSSPRPDGGRYNPLARDALGPAGRKVWDEIAAGPRGAVLAPHKLLLASPELADLAQRMGAFLRYCTSLSAAQSELAILIVAQYWRSKYEWAHHAPIALGAGVPPAALDALHAGIAPQLENPSLDVIYAVAAALLKSGEIDDTTFKSAHEILGDKALTELVGIVGYYTTLALLMNVYNTPATA